MSIKRPRLLAILVCLFIAYEPVSAGGKVRTYYIAAEETEWDYAPSYPGNPITGDAFTAMERVFIEGNGSDRIGRVYKKARYVEYTDATFAAVKARPPEWEHLGILGPVIFANVGETIEVVFRNKSSRPTSIHPHGVFYLKDSEGMLHDDGTDGADKADDSVAPGASHTYVWEVPERAGPAPADGSSIVWLYHSHVDEPADTNAGLVGPIIVSRPGHRSREGRLRGVDREVVVLFTVFDENASRYLEDNIAAYAPAADADDGDFQESNLMHAVNGYVYGNLPAITMKAREKVRWYQLALGTEVDLHTPHWHGNTLTTDRHRVDVVNLLPATQLTLDMKPDNVGTWLYHCHVNDHMHAGMVTTYTVMP